MKITLSKLKTLIRETIENASALPTVDEAELCEADEAQIGDTVRIFSKINTNRPIRAYQKPDLSGQSTNIAAGASAKIIRKEGEALAIQVGQAQYWLPARMVMVNPLRK